MRNISRPARARLLARRSVISYSIERLEPRLLLAATVDQIANAIELAAGTPITFTGDQRAVKVFQINTTGGLLGFPAGPDDDFLMLSTGNADEIVGSNSSGSQGTDLGETGVAGDAAEVRFTATIPAAQVVRRLKFNFMFLSEEYPEFVGSSFNDIFSATVNGQEVALDQGNNPISVNSVLFTGSAATDTIFDGRTQLLTASYTVQPGVTDLNVVLNLADIGDGNYDSAVFVDSFRIERKQQVFLDFDGQEVGSHFGFFTDMNIRDFRVTDLGFTNATPQGTVEDQILNAVAAKFAPYDIDFFKGTEPEGEFMRVVVGGDMNDPIELSLVNSILRAALGTFFPPFRQYWLATGHGPGTLFGKADAIDIGNGNQNDLVTIFSGEHNISNTTADNIAELAVTIAHEIGHSLGLRHVDNSNTGDIMKQNAPTPTSAVFQNVLLGFPDEETWPDGERTQNSDLYLRGVLGLVNGNGTGVLPLGDPKVFTKPLTLAGLSAPIFDAFALIQGADSGGLTDVGNDAHVTSVSLGNLAAGVTNVTVPWAPPGSKILVMGSSQPGGGMDIASGTPTNGALSIADMFVPFVDAAGTTVQSIPLATGEFGALQPLGTMTLAEGHTTAPQIDFLPRNRGKFTDADGDTYQVTMSGPGQIAVVLDDPDGDGQGAIGQIVLQDTTAERSSVTIKKGKTVGDGVVPIGSITGGGVRSFVSLGSDLSGAATFSGAVGQLRMRDVAGAAQVTIGGDASRKTKLTFRSVADGATFNLGTTIGNLTAANVGRASFTAPAMQTLKVSGNFNADLTLGTLGTATVKQTVQGATWRVAGAIKSARIGALVDSNVFAGVQSALVTLPDSADDFVGDSVLTKIAITGIRGVAFAFSNSNIAAASIGNASVALYDPDNGGVPFGLATLDLGSLKLKTADGTLRWRRGNDPTLLETPDDFVTRLL